MIKKTKYHLKKYIKKFPLIFFKFHNYGGPLQNPLKKITNMKTKEMLKNYHKNGGPLTILKNIFFEIHNNGGHFKVI